MRPSHYHRACFTVEDSLSRRVGTAGIFNSYIEKTLALQCVISLQEARWGPFDSSTDEWTAFLRESSIKNRRKGFDFISGRNYHDNNQ
jgi:hypothetical protein